jgi:hypothetical protein
MKAQSVGGGWSGVATGYPLVEKNWERSAKVFGDRLMLGDGPVNPKPYSRLKKTDWKAN